ncbi:tRNA lysidine(34) synthetase TilS [Marilutibacter chinensis]|uniref:tRNA(Ile)-lysidine synthase n=1 Tax=Marilutibacter chinensis TaxID=2912247 RepID=A0ABS9HWX2_9GAMM|nr:tRNA lysidine(34) synthetase TilS [Lysobacter chinensis]MCF7222680.1 tRNA lysidine(34) synthetase TilS [Lysobacter chinensis]
MLPDLPSDAPKPTPLLVACSGGLDSSVLLHLLAGDPARRADGLRAIHVHHGLHPDADAWARHCRRLCDGLGIPLITVRVEVPRDSGAGPEAAARRVRHAAFEAELATDEVLVVGHHLDDQAETFLLRALRASGTDGLAAMRPWRRYGPGWLWRPLLGIPRTELLTHARTHGLAWIEDPSNADTALDRNFLRQRVLPLLRERWPHAGAALARSAALSAEAAGLLDSGDAQALAAAIGADPGCIDVATLLALPAARRRRVLRRWIQMLSLPPLPANGIARLEADLLQARGDADACFRWAGARIRRWRGLMHAGRERAPLPDDLDLPWDGRQPLALPGGGSLQLEGSDALPEPCRVHARRGGERIVLPGRAHRHALKQVLQDLGIPPWVRERLPLLGDAAGRLLAAGDLVYSAAFDEWLRSNGARLVWYDDPPAPLS